MEKVDLSIIIPARNEMFLARTVEDILANIEGRTEIIVILDGQLADPPVPVDDRIRVIYHAESRGQRASTNDGARIARGKYIMKVDAHCAFDKGFDVKMISEMKDDYTMIPEMRNLHAFDWVCDKCGNRWFQSPTPTFCNADYDGKTRNPNCDSTSFHREMIWKPNRRRPKNHHYRFDNTLHFQYFRELGERPEIIAQGDIVDTMCAQGSCFMLTKKKYFELDICDEKHGSWGQQGVEVGCKTWLSGGRLVTNKKTWYAHMFRTQGGDFGFPYPNPGSKQEEARRYSRDLWLNNKWPLAKHDLQWLINKFAPVPDWDFSVGLLYYSDGLLDEKILKACQDQILESKGSRRLVSVTLKPMDFGENFSFKWQRGYITMARQILYGLKELKTDVVFFLEHDVLYHPTHFDFVPPKKDVFYYNTNVWRMRLDDGHAIRTDDCKQLSGLCVYRETAIEHFEKRVKVFEEMFVKDPDNFTSYVRKVGFEPGTHNRKERIDDFKADSWESKYPNVDIRHNTNLTESRWSPDQFRNEKFTKGWKESKDIPGWGNTENIIKGL